MYNKITIDYNIFGYTQEEKIKIVSIPEGIKFYKITDNDNNNNKEEIFNGTIIDKNIKYSLYQNKSLLKTYEYYDIYYQYLIKEPNYSDTYNNAHSVYTHSQDNNGYNNYQNDFEQNIFYGRINKITFKL